MSDRSIFYDASAWIALYDRDDECHPMVVTWHKQIAENKLFIVTSNFVLAETHAFFCRDPAQALKIAHILRSSQIVRYQRVTADDEKRAVEILAKYDDKDFSFCDATSFSLIERLEIPQALSLDKHFQQYGVPLYG